MSDMFIGIINSFLAGSGWKDEIGRNVTDLIVLGEIAQMYNIPDALKYAIYNLRYHRNFHRGIRVQYACTFGIPNWGLQGTKEILASSVGVGAEMDKAKLENDVVGILYAGQANQRFYTHLLTNTIPKIDDDPSWVSCPSKKACQKILARGWSDVIVPALKVNMESLVHLQVIIELKVIGNPDIMQDPDPAFSSMHSTCRRALCDRVDQVVTRISDFIGEETGNMVKDYIKKKHPQVHDNEGWVI
ncbi:hypothetical protein D9757_011239 [Collybiopsis confluens]|uniref:Uncharacterized protein n=1 Tax=Collybiopsis confluens TaxID=2823264 RepID=A0A8H5GMY7_9AGAR|nr:hypothetical protein D9757_011239 [Collybiopsis confluens]